MSDRRRFSPIAWLERFWADLLASTDTSLLGVARFLGLLYGPIDHRLQIDQALRKALRHRLPRHAGWRHALGGITYVLLMILVVTGVLLAFYYRPSQQEAYASVQHIVTGVPLGWLIRDLHVWSASLLVLAVLAHMARIFFDAAYKPPRETNWLVGLLLLLVVLAFGATGYLLPWDQWAYWTVTEVLDGLEGFPVLGGLAVSLVKGDEFVSGATLSRFFALHVIVLPWILLWLLLFHFAMVRRHGIAPPEGATTVERTVPFFPHHLLRSFIVGVLVLATAVTVAVLYPRPIGEPANPSQLPEELVSTWVPVDVSLALIRYTGAWGLGLFTVVALGLAVLPLFDRSAERRLSHRPVAVALGLVFFVGFLGAWFAGRQLRSVPPTARPVPETIDLPARSGVPLPDIGPTPVRPAPRSPSPGEPEPR